MQPHFIAISLPPLIRSRLAKFCYGLPQVQWVEEENFHLKLRYFGVLQSSIITSIQERLYHLFFESFSIVLQGLSHFHTKNKQGALWIGIAENPHLVALKKEIDRLLKDLYLPKEEHHFHPHITLGRYNHLNPQRLSDYLHAYGDYQSWPIEVSTCLLIRSLHTPKHIIYETVDKYMASQLATGED